ncbi:MAG: hypothetical protein ACT4N2_00810 [Hyphomicrobium sp.]
MIANLRIKLIAASCLLSRNLSTASITNPQRINVREVDMTSRCCLIAWLFAAFLASALPARADKEATLNIVAAAIADPDDDNAFQKFLGTLPKVKSPLDKVTQFYLVEGDMPMTEKQVRNYLRGQNSAGKPTSQSNPELLVNVSGGKPTFWKDKASRTLKYSVMRASFPSQAKYDKVVADLAGAGRDWTNACAACGIKFVHVSELDSLDDPFGYLEPIKKDTIRFVVFYSDYTAADPWNAYIARAFFPGDAEHLRTVVIDSSYFNYDGSKSKIFTGRGILRHELGHALGYRHEHIRDVAGCSLEDKQWKPLTNYDGKSVMHYNCGASQNRGDFVLTPLDKQGHTKLYTGR